MLQKEEFIDHRIAVLVQGPITYTDEIIQNYLPFKKNVILSTNSVNNIEDLNKLKGLEFTIVESEICDISGRANFNNQVRTTYEGLKKAKELNFHYVLKIRSDIFIENLSHFISLINLNDFYFSAFHNYDGGYLCEHMLFGETDKMIKLWDIPISTSDLPPETQLTNNFIKNFPLLKVEFLFSILINNNIKTYWIKHNKFLNDYKNDKLFIYE
jgi:hypothetical protein